MSKNLEGQQIMILPEGSNRILGRDAQRSNIAVAYAVANIVRTTLGHSLLLATLLSALAFAQAYWLKWMVP